MGIGILIVVIGSLIYKGRSRIQNILGVYRNKFSKKEPIYRTIIFWYYNITRLDATVRYKVLAKWENQ